MKKNFDDIRNDAKTEFNPTLNELNQALTKAVRAIKGEKLENKSVIIKGFSIYNAENSDNSFFAPAKESEIFLVAKVDGENKEFGLQNNCFSDNSKIIDVIISINALEQSSSYSSEFRDSLLNFAINKVMIKVKDGQKAVNPESIVYLEANGNSTKIFYANGEMELNPNSLGDFKKILPFEFFYNTHTSFYVNVNYIDSIKNNYIEDKNISENDTNEKGKMVILLDNNLLSLEDRHKDFKVLIPISDKWELGFLDFLQRRQRF